MRLENYQVEELMWWAKTHGGPINRVKLEISLEEWEASLYDYSHDAIVARVFLVDPKCDHEVNVCECRPLAEKRLA